MDIINPLQHIPVVSTIYRNATGDEIAPGTRLLGAGLFAGPIGMALASVNIVAEGVTGQDLGEHALAMFDGSSDQPELASEQNPPTAAAHPDLQRSAPLSEVLVPAQPGYLAATLLENATQPQAPGVAELNPELAAQHGLADKILDALDKYQSMARARQDEPDASAIEEAAGEL